MLEIHEELKVIDDEKAQLNIQARLNLVITHLAGLIAFAYMLGGRNHLKGAVDKINEDDEERRAASHEMPHSDDVELKI